MNGQNKKASNKENVVFNVAMDCHSCQQKIEKNIAFEKGVRAMNVSLEKQTVEITFDKRKTNIEKLQRAFKELGYPATLQAQEPLKKLEFLVIDIQCSFTKKCIEKIQLINI
jgi:copper chaperone CopZ